MSSGLLEIIALLKAVRLIEDGEKTIPEAAAETFKDSGMSLEDWTADLQNTIKLRKEAHAKSLLLSCNP